MFRWLHEDPLPRYGTRFSNFYINLQVATLMKRGYPLDESQRLAAGFFPMLTHTLILKDTWDQNYKTFLPQLMRRIQVLLKFLLTKLHVTSVTRLGDL